MQHRCSKQNEGVLEDDMRRVRKLEMKHSSTVGFHWPALWKPSLLLPHLQKGNSGTVLEILI